MLPCHVSGRYGFDESHIDLRPLTRFANCRLYMDRAIGLDMERREVICANHPPVSFDVLSIDTGSTPATVKVPGAEEYSIPAKPVPETAATVESAFAGSQGKSYPKSHHRHGGRRRWRGGADPEHAGTAASFTQGTWTTHRPGYFFTCSTGGMSWLRDGTAGPDGGCSRFFGSETFNCI